MDGEAELDVDGKAELGVVVLPGPIVMIVPLVIVTVKVVGSGIVEGSLVRVMVFVGITMDSVTV